MYYISNKYREVIVTDLNQYQKVTTIKRKPRASLASNHSRTVKPSLNSAVLTRKQPAVVPRSTTGSSFSEQQQLVTAQQSTMPAQSTNNASKSTKVQQQSIATAQSPTGKQMKESAIQQALRNVSKTSKKKKKGFNSVDFGIKRILLAAVCASVAVFAIVYFVNINAPNISLKVAAMQSGIDASYPSYVPRDFNLTDITSESGRITISFRNSTTGCSFSLLEEKTSWDSNALLNNYVKDNIPYYSTVKEQGLTIYMGDNISAWVNNGVAYKLKVTAGSLTKKQVKSIAVSL